MSKKLYKYFIAIIIVAIILVWVIFDLEQFLTLEAIKQQYQIWRSFVDDHYIVSFLGFFCFYVVFTAISLPWSILLTSLAAALFGFLPAILLSSFAMTIGATIAFLISRYLLRDFMARKFVKTSAKINQEVNKNGKLYLLSLRIAPVFSFVAINIIMALTSMRTKDFYLITQVGMIPTILIYAYFGQELAQVTSLKELISLPLLISLLLLATLPWILKGMITIFNRYKLYFKIKDII